VEAVPAAEMGWAAARPSNVAMATERGQLLPTFEAAIGRFADHFGRHPEANDDETCLVRGSKEPEVVEAPLVAAE
jgi:hypothetical protein